MNIGIAEGRTNPPMVTVPNSEFAQRGGLWTLEESVQERTLYPTLDVTLVQPTLSVRPGPWKFKLEGLPEFTATMMDQRFLKALESSHIEERLRTGIQMRIRLEIKEKKTLGGDWEVKKRGRSVVEVISPKVN